MPESAACTAARATRPGRAPRLARLALPLLLLLVRAAAAQAPAADPRVERLLARMTLEEKVGQMTQMALQTVSRTPASDSTRLVLDPAKLEDVLVRHHVGSILNVYDRALTGPQWQELVGTLQRTARRTRLKIPVLYGIDAVHGGNYLVGATLFPQNLGMAATWDPELVRRAGEVTARETRASGIPWNFGPVLDLGRQPLWPRFYETYGEDPYLASVLGAAAVAGMQGDDLAADDRVAASGKHFLGYGMPLSGLDRTTAWIPTRQLYEYFLPPFRAAVDAGLATLMVNSADINGVPVHADSALLTGLLRRELGFRGLVVSDWNDIIRLHTVHHVAATNREAVRMAVLAGIDMSMVPLDFSFYDDLLALVREGAIPESRIDVSVRRILQLKADLGLLDRADPDPALLPRIGAAEHRALSLRAARESMTLLKNAPPGGAQGAPPLLPLARSARVLVTGPAADDVPALFGGWSYTWQGNDPRAYPAGLPTLLQAVRGAVGEARVTYVPGSGFTDEVDIPAAVAAARGADVAIVALGEAAEAETPGNIDDLALPATQLRLARAIAETGTPVVLVLVEARPRLLGPAADAADAVLLAYEPGPFGAQAITEVLFGDVNPGGKLPFTYPRSPNVLVPYDHAYSAAVAGDDVGGAFHPQWEFGHGLSYTRFAYGDPSVERSSVGPGDTLRIAVDVANTGPRAGTEVVQLYVRDLYASVAPPAKRLRAFQRVLLQPGESRTVRFALPVRSLAFVGRDDRPVLEPGEFELRVGERTLRFTVQGERP